MKKGHTCAAIADVMPLIPPTKKGRKALACAEPEADDFAADTWRTAEQ